jgi:malate dehydrogenase (oxaloacetate-decarboxylating)
LEELTPHQQLFVRTADELSGWELDTPGPVKLLDVVRNARPSCLIGVSGQAGLFSEAVVREMARINERPIIMPLSNPTARVEATPENIVKWSEGRALIATGSPFAPVYDNGIVHAIAQCNNSYAFPGMGLGALAVKARRISDEMFMAAARVVGAAVPVSRNLGAPLLPPLTEIRSLSREIAIAVARTAVEQGLSPVNDPEEVVGLVDSRMWMPRYREFA